MPETVERIRGTSRENEAGAAGAPPYLIPIAGGTPAMSMPLGTTGQPAAGQSCGSMVRASGENGAIDVR